MFLGGSFIQHVKQQVKYHVNSNCLSALESFQFLKTAFFSVLLLT